MHRILSATVPDSKGVTAIAHANVMMRDLGSLRKFDSEDRCPIFRMTVGEFASAA